LSRGLCCFPCLDLQVFRRSPQFRLRAKWPHFDVRADSGPSPVLLSVSSYFPGDPIAPGLSFLRTGLDGAPIAIQVENRFGAGLHTSPG
jgi:hypothetical protein